MRGLPGSDAWLSPPDPKVPPSGDTVIYVERPMPWVFPFAEPDDLTAADWWLEFEVVVTFDEGSVWSATLDGKDLELTADEKQRAEEDWAMREPDGPDEDDRRDR